MKTQSLISTSLSAMILGGMVNISAQDYSGSQNITGGIITSGSDNTTNFNGDGNTVNEINGGITSSDGNNIVNFNAGTNTVIGKVGIAGNNSSVTVNFNDQTKTNTIRGFVYTGYNRTTKVDMKGSVSNIVDGYVLGES